MTYPLNEPVQKIFLKDIHINRETQIRAAVSEETVQKYYDRMLDERCRKTFPPILLYQDDEGNYWLADGHHRVLAAIRRKFRSIFAVVRRGTKADAVWEAAKSNGRHGLPLCRADIRRTVEMIAELLPDRSNRMIADAIGCCEKTIRKYRPSNPNAENSKPEKRMGKNGKFYSVKKKEQKGHSCTKLDDTMQDSQTEPNSPESMAQRKTQSNIKEVQIFNTISLLGTQIGEWFEIALEADHENFDRRVRKRIAELID